MSDAVMITLIICGTVICLGIIGSIDNMNKQKKKLIV